LVAFIGASPSAAGRSCTEPFRFERRGIDEGRVAGHQVREEAAGDGAERQAQVMVPNVEP
jgi:hypothetical protein